MYDKIYIQPSALKRLSSLVLLNLLNNWHVIQYWQFTPDVQMKIKKLY